GTLGLGDTILVLLARQRAGFDHAVAEYRQRLLHRADLVVLTGADDLGVEVTGREQLHGALKLTDGAQDVAADIKPDEQRRADQRQSAQRQHRGGGERDLLARPEGRRIGLLLHAVDERLHADAETDIELAGLVQDGLAVVDGIELLLADLEHAGLALAEGEQLLHGVAHGLHRGNVREVLEIRLDAVAG